MVGSWDILTHQAPPLFDMYYLVHPLAIAALALAAFALALATLALFALSLPALSLFTSAPGVIGLPRYKTRLASPHSV